MHKSLKNLVLIAVMSTVAGVLMLLEFPLLFIAPNFMKFDISEIPAIFIGFYLGPIHGIIVIILKNFIKIVLKSTSTAFVGEFVNVMVGCCYVLSASLIYKIKHNKSGAIVSLICGTIIVSIFATILNAYITFPMYANIFGMPLDAIVALVTKVNPIVKDYITLMFFSVFPFNIIKYVIISFMTFFLYKRVGYVLDKIIERK